MSDVGWNQWHEMWWQIAIKPWLDDARIEMRKIMPLDPGSDYMDYEDLAHTVAYECAPTDDDIIVALADIYPPVWAWAYDLDDTWGPGTEMQALHAAVSYWMYYELLDLIPQDDYQPHLQAA